MARMTAIGEVWHGRVAVSRRDAFAAAIGLVAAGCVKRRARPDFDPFMVWRESARFDREVLGPMQDRLARAMCESIDRQWRQSS